MTGFITPGDPADLGDVPLFELADNETNGNKRYGHIALIPVGERYAGASFLDLGPVLKFSAQHGGQMAPATVRALATELEEWADRKGGTTSLADGVRAYLDELRAVMDESRRDPDIRHISVGMVAIRLKALLERGDV